MDPFVSLFSLERHLDAKDGGYEFVAVSLDGQFRIALELDAVAGLDPAAVGDIIIGSQYSTAIATKN